LQIICTAQKKASLQPLSSYLTYPVIQKLEYINIDLYLFFFKNMASVNVKRTNCEKIPVTFSLPCTYYTGDECYDVEKYDYFHLSKNKPFQINFETYNEKITNIIEDALKYYLNFNIVAERFQQEEENSGIEYMIDKNTIKHEVLKQDSEDVWKMKAIYQFIENFSISKKLIDPKNVCKEMLFYRVFKDDTGLFKLDKI